ncbi:MULTISPECIES: hypothetical protein, partial [unclassified Microcoleus]|uniref:hypothetical protein n=1 Tax=unclassified Microcoleus TaxID=2642155 RepID=UPI002FCF4DCA
MALAFVPKFSVATSSRRCLGVRDLIPSTPAVDLSGKEEHVAASSSSGKVRASPLSPPLRTQHESFQLTA